MCPPLEHADMRVKCIMAICDMLNFEYDVYNFSCTNTNIYSLLCKDKLMMVKRLVHPPEGINDNSWVTPQFRRASARSKILLMLCHDDTIKHWFLVAILSGGEKKKRVLIFDSISLSAGQR